MAWIIVGSTVVGGIMANSAAKKQAAAIDRQNEAAMAGYYQYEPYVDAGLKGGETAFNNVLDQGPYQGQTLADRSQYQLGVLGMGQNIAGNAMNSGSGLMNTGAGFGANANALYNGAMTNADRIGNYQGNFNDVVNNNNRISGMTEGLATDVARTADAYGRIAGNIDNARRGYGAAANDYRNIQGQFGNISNQFGNLGNQFGQLGNDQRAYEGNFKNLAGQNQDITNRFTNMANEASGVDRLQKANQYAQDNASPLVDAMLRDDRRNLTENTLTGINMSASGSGNANSSRAGVADAIANRAFNDRRADTMATVQDQLRTASLNQQNTAFDQTSNSLTNAANSITNTGNLNNAAMGTIDAQGNMLNNQGNSLANQGNALNNSANMVTNRANMTTNDINAMGLAGNQINNRGNALTTSANMLNTAGDRYGTGLTNAVGNINSMNNAYNTAGGFNTQLGNAYTTGFNTANSGFGMGMGIGDTMYGYDQARLNDQRQRYEANRDFNYNMYKDYMSGMLGKAPTSTGVKYNDSVVDTGMSTFSGAMSGLGFGLNYGPQISNAFSSPTVPGPPPPRPL